MASKTIEYYCKACGFISNRDFDECPACSKRQIYTNDE